MPGVPAVTQPFGVGLGQQSPFRQDNPATGAGASWQMDGKFVRRLISLVFTVTAANAGSSRQVTVEYQGKDGLAFSVNGPASLLAINTANRYAGSISYAVSDFATGTDVFFPLDPVFLFPGDVLAIVIGGVQAGDAITNVRGVEERFSYDVLRLPEREAG